MLVDTHCHLNFKAFDDDWRAVAQRAYDAGVKGIINVGSNYDTSCRAIEIAQINNSILRATPPLRGSREVSIQGKLYAAVGLHPIHVGDEEFDIKQYENLISNHRPEPVCHPELVSGSHSGPCEIPDRVRNDTIMAIGETGLDLFHSPDTIDKQKEVFKQFLVLASRSKKPIVIHNRMAGTEIMAILNTTKDLPRGVMHFFSEDWRYARKLFDLGFYISFTGAITLNNIGADTIEVVKKAPLNRIMIETDAPYVVPRRQKNKNIKRNEPAFVTEVAHRIAAIKNISIEKVAHQTTQSAIELFGLA